MMGVKVLIAELSNRLDLGLRKYRRRGAIFIRSQAKRRNYIINELAEGWRYCMALKDLHILSLNYHIE